MSELPEYVQRNRDFWDARAPEYVSPGEAHWLQVDPSWGIWGVPEVEVGMFPDRVDGLDAIELGCGTAYVAAWLTRRGARVVGIDNSQTQLETARRLQHEHDVHFPLLHGNAESVPYPNASFDFAISEYGACLWADPFRFIPEAARLLRPGGQLSFLTNSWLMMLCVPDRVDEAATDRLVRTGFGMHRMQWPDSPEVEFHLAHGDWIRLLRRSGFEIIDLVEIRPPAHATTRYPFVTLPWARQWPCEEVWKARRL
jgi:SAM-dependent methyltransferase